MSQEKSDRVVTTTMRIKIPYWYEYKLKYLMEVYRKYGWLNEHIDASVMEENLLCYIIDKEFNQIAASEHHKLEWNELVKKNAYDMEDRKKCARD